MSSSSSSTSSTSNSGSSDSGSTSSDSESSTTVEEKEENAASKSQVVTRRKSSECKAAAKAAESEKTVTTTTTVNKPNRPNSNTAAARRSSGSGEENVLPKKNTTLTTTSTTTAPTSTQTTSSTTTTTSTTTTSTVTSTTSVASNLRRKPAPANQPATNTRTKSQPATNIKTPPTKKNAPNSVEKREANTSTVSDSDKEPNKPNTGRRQVKEKSKPPTKQQPSRAPKQLPSTPAKGGTRKKSCEGSESGNNSTASAGRLMSESSESEEEDASDSSNSFMSQPMKAVKGKRVATAIKADTNRKLTRSFSTRQSKQQATNKLASADASNSDTDFEDLEKRSLSKSPAKRVNTVSKSKAKKEIGLGSLMGICNIIQPHPPSLSPQHQVEKKCPIEGCDSSGHLSGNLDKHFLPEACPIYHNMSVSECKERASERKMREEQQQKAEAVDADATVTSTVSSTPNQESLNHRLLSPEQREFLNKIKESRALFRPIAASLNTDKVKIEKECTDEDREPCLNGIVPDYDLQLFREAQAIASEQIEDEVKDLAVGKGIKYITMGKYKMKVWYQSPYPDDAARLPQMYICEFCLRYRKSEIGIKRHAQKCVWRHPPGDEIYRKGKLQVWQVDGKRYKQYCQHLCLLAKFFLDHKTLYYDVEPFLFYIMTLADVDGCHTVGYFSKEKNSFYNVSCILTLPPYQRKGYGRLLIDFSYLLTRVEGKIGSPEKPLSDLGLISYRSYWKDVLLDYLCSRSGNTLSIKDVSQEMAIYSYDIVSTLQALGMMKYWKGKHIVLKKQDVLDEYEERVKRRGNFPKIDETCLRWSPFVPTQTNNSH